MLHIYCCMLVQSLPPAGPYIDAEVYCTVFRCKKREADSVNNDMHVWVVQGTGAEMYIYVQ